MVYGLWFSCIWSQNKTRKKVVLTSDLCWNYFSLWGSFHCCQIIPVLRSWSVVWFYFTFIFIIEFVLMVFNMKFVSDGL